MSYDAYQHCEMCGDKVGEHKLTFRDDPDLGSWGAWVCDNCEELLDERKGQEENED